jgi:hypothetical protein
LYTIYLYLLTNAEIVSALPRRIKNLTVLASTFFILLIVVFNEIAAITGVSIRNIPTDNRDAAKTIVAVGSSGSPEQQLWTISTSFTLAFLTSFQIAVFCFAFFRLSQTIFSRKRFQSQHNAKVQLIKGIGWISGSLMLGAIETVMGFAVGGFGVVLSRRILRLLTRASLCIGVIKGVDDFHVLSQFHEIISNPRFSTFRQLSPKATTFHVAQHPSDTQENSATYRTLPTPGLPDMAHFADLRAENGHQRVAVRYHQGTPLLHLRFSTLDMPSPANIVEEIKARPQSELELPQPLFSHHQSGSRDSSDSASSFFAPFELVSAPRRTLSQRSARAQLCQAAVPTTSEESTNPDPTTTTTAVESRDLSRVQSMKSLQAAVQDLAGQFPGPPMAFKDGNTRPIMPSVVPVETPPIPQALGSPSELQFKRPSSSSHEGFVLSDDSEWSSNLSSPVAFSDNKSVRSTRQPTLYNVTGTPLKSASLIYSEKSFDPFNDEDEVDSLSSSRTATVKTISRPVSDRSQDAAEAGMLDLATALSSAKSRQSQIRKPRSSPKVTTSSSKVIPLSTKVRSVGEDPRKSTSLPRHTNHRRGNVQLQDIIIPPRRLNMPEILDESRDDDSNATLRRDV